MLLATLATVACRTVARADGDTLRPHDSPQSSSLAVQAGDRLSRRGAIHRVDAAPLKMFRAGWTIGGQTDELHLTTGHILADGPLRVAVRNHVANSPASDSRKGERDRGTRARQAHALGSRPHSNAARESDLVVQTVCETGAVVTMTDTVATNRPTAVRCSRSSTCA